MSGARDYVRLVRLRFSRISLRSCNLWSIFVQIVIYSGQVHSCQVMQQWMWHKFMLCLHVCVLGWQPRVCMRMCNT